MCAESTKYNECLCTARDGRGDHPPHATNDNIGAANERYEVTYSQFSFMIAFMRGRRFSLNPLFARR